MVVSFAHHTRTYDKVQMRPEILTNLWWLTLVSRERLSQLEEGKGAFSSQKYPLCSEPLEWWQLFSFICLNQASLSNLQKSQCRLVKTLNRMEKEDQRKVYKISKWVWYSRGRSRNMQSFEYFCYLFTYKTHTHTYIHIYVCMYRYHIFIIFLSKKYIAM